MMRVALVAHAVVLMVCISGLARADALSRSPTCPGLGASSFEQRIPAGTRRVAFERASLILFVELWHALEQRPLAAFPERVMMYLMPHRPLMIGYQRQGCIIAVLAVEPPTLVRWLRPRLGWSV